MKQGGWNVVNKDRARQDRTLSIFTAAFIDCTEKYASKLKRIVEGMRAKLLSYSTMESALFVIRNVTCMYQNYNK